MRESFKIAKNSLLKPLSKDDRVLWTVDESVLSLEIEIDKILFHKVDFCYSDLLDFEKTQEIKNIERTKTDFIGIITKDNKKGIFKRRLEKVKHNLCFDGSNLSNV